MADLTWIVLLSVFGTWGLVALILPWFLRLRPRPHPTTDHPVVRYPSTEDEVAVILMWPMALILWGAENIASVYWRLATGRDE